MSCIFITFKQIESFKKLFEDKMNHRIYSNYLILEQKRLGIKREDSFLLSAVLIDLNVKLYLFIMTFILSLLILLNLECVMLNFVIRLIDLWCYRLIVRISTQLKSKDLLYVSGYNVYVHS